MEHFRLRKYRGPETWAKVREAYLAGEPAPAVARRFDVGLANLRKKASREGWTRNLEARRHDLKPIRGDRDPPPPAIGPLNPGDPIGRALANLHLPTEPDDRPIKVREALRRAVHHSCRLLAEGRIPEAHATLRAAQALATLTATFLHME